jgi:hypothetical protein
MTSRHIGQSQPSPDRCAALIREPTGFISDGSDKRRCRAAHGYDSRFCGLHKRTVEGSWKDGGWNKPSIKKGGES